MSSSRGPEDPLWYKDAIIYETTRQSFLRQQWRRHRRFRRADREARLPAGPGRHLPLAAAVFPSPLRDDGYDIADYTNVHPSYGTLDDFKTFLTAAHERRPAGASSSWSSTTRPISIPGFRRRGTRPAGSPERDFYVWSDTIRSISDARIIFAIPRNRTGRGIRSRRPTTGTAFSHTSRI